MMVSKKENSATFSIGILDVLQIVLITLKCFDLIVWPWWKVFLPLMIEAALVGLTIGILALISFITKRKRNKEG